MWSEECYQILDWAAKRANSSGALAAGLLKVSTEAIVSEGNRRRRKQQVWPFHLCSHYDKQRKL